MTQKTTTGTSASNATGTETGGRAKRLAANIGLWVLQVGLAVSLAFAGFSKVTAEERTAEGFAEIGAGDWFMYLIGALELAGAVALLIPILSGLAGLAFCGLMIGAVITQAVVFDGDMVAVPAVYLVLAVIIAWGRRQRTVQLAALVRRAWSH